MGRFVRTMAAAAALAVFGTALAGPAAAENRRFVRDFVAESRTLLGDVDAARQQLATNLGTPSGRPDPSRKAGASMEQFHRSFAGSMGRVGGKLRRLSESRQRAENTLSQREAQFTGEIQGDLRRIVQRLSVSQLMLTESPARQAQFFEDIGKQAEAVRRKLQEYQ